MPCMAPIRAYKTKERNPETGKSLISFDRKSAGPGKSAIDLPCGKCAGCVMENSRDWAIRCMHERRMHAKSCFATLTYDRENLPAYGSLSRRDLQLFNKRLRKRKGRFRFFACGEYGDTNFRPHYHLLIFGLDFEDKKLVGKNGNGDSLYDSEELRDIWQSGNIQLGDVNFKSAAYVAGYVDKKAFKPFIPDYIDPVTGEVKLERIKEFRAFSNRPGIGTPYYEKYGQSLRDHDTCIIDGREVRPPRYYDKKTEALDPVVFNALKKRRRKMAVLLNADNTVDRRRVKEIIALKRLREKKRML